MCRSPVAPTLRTGPLDRAGRQEADDPDMRIEPRFLNWGLFFILLGAVPLAVQQGVLDRNSLVDWWRLWPLIIVGIGAAILLRRTPAEFLGGLVIAATFGLMLGAGLATGNLGELGSIACAGTGGSQSFATQSAPLTGDSASIEINQDCGDVSVSTTNGGAWMLTGDGRDGQPPNIDASNSRLVVSSRHAGDGAFFDRTHENWSLALPSGISTSVDATVNAGRGTFDLSGSQVQSANVQGNAGDFRLDFANTSVRDVSLSVNAGSGRVNLPASNVSVHLDVNAGSIAFCVPDGTGLQIETNDNITAGNNFGDRGLTKSGSVWETPGYDSNATRIQINASANAGSFSLNPQEGCR